jgi:uncharacterized membrane protein
MGKAFAATLLEAARLGYITIQETEDSVFFGLIKHTDLIYALTQKGVDLLDGKPITIQPGMRYLEQFEVEALRTAICEAGTGIMVTTDQLVSWAKMGYKQNTNFRRFASDWGEANRKWFVNNYFQLDDKVSAKAAGWFICILIAVGAFGTWLVSPSLIFVLIPVLTFVLLIMGIASLSRRTKEGALEMQRWEAFKRFMTDFSAMNEAGPGLLPLWEKYLVYATALGVATKLLENVKSLAQESNYTFSQVGWFTPMHSDGIDSISSMNFSSLDSLSNAMSNFDSLTAALSSSTSSGGGFSGGGGGGGGGGSSGAG